MAETYLTLLATVITVLSSFKITKVTYFKNILILYAVVNFPIIFLIKDEQGLYLTAYTTTLILLFTIKKFINKTYYTDSYIGLEGIVLMSPKLSLFVRLNLLMIGNFPPFLNFGVVFNHLINNELSVKTIYILLAIIFNFILFSKLSNKLLFGKPNKNIVYKDIEVKEVILMGSLSLFNLIYGIYYLLNI